MWAGVNQLSLLLLKSPGSFLQLLPTALHIYAAHPVMFSKHCSLKTLGFYSEGFCYLSVDSGVEHQSKKILSDHSDIHHRRKIKMDCVFSFFPLAYAEFAHLQMEGLKGVGIKNLGLDKASAYTDSVFGPAEIEVKFWPHGTLQSI